MELVRGIMKDKVELLKYGCEDNERLLPCQGSYTDAISKWPNCMRRPCTCQCTTLHHCPRVSKHSSIDENQPSECDI